MNNAKIYFAFENKVYTYKDYADEKNVCVSTAHKLLRNNLISECMDRPRRQFKQTKTVNTAGRCKAKTFRDCFECTLPDCVRNEPLAGEPGDDVNPRGKDYYEDLRRD